MENKEEKDEPSYIEHKIAHYQQRYNWDCGVTCVLMVLSPSQQEELLGSFHQICAEEGFNQSTWTIDLCYLLKRFGIQHQMYTIMAGVNEGYRKHEYYDKILDLDRERVRRRFAQAQGAGVSVSARALPARDLLRHLRHQGPAIVLVDAGLLVCQLCKHNKLKAEFRRWFGGEYSGHYVCAVGVSGGRVLYRDPALPARLCAAPAHALWRAAAAPGTDRDIILVYRDVTSHQKRSVP